MAAMRWIAGFLMALLWSPFICAGAIPQEGTTLDAILSVNVEEGPKKIALNQDYMIAGEQEGEQRKIPVVLAFTVYRCKMLRIRGGTRDTDNDLRVDLYELYAKEKGDLFSWSICTGSRPLGMFRLLSNEGGMNYLAWADSRDVCFTSLNQPRDRVVALSEAVTRGLRRVPGEVIIPTGTLIEPRYHGRNALHTELALEALDVAKDGRITAKISSPASREPFILTFNGKEWHAE